MKNKITNLSQIKEAQDNPCIDIPYYTKSSYGTTIQIDGESYVVQVDDLDNLSKAIESKKLEVLSRKRDQKILNIIDDKQV